ncbi:hypothetical protein FB451DRAFT_1379047 [Mycena latifolia]|nr:hypothetical protein FB451DRAFT_1379047 [Mycena latifolia]
MNVGPIVLPLVHEYSGADFFSGWDFYGRLEGNTNFLNRTEAVAQHLISVSGNGTAILKVENAIPVPGAPSSYPNSVRVISTETYSIGSHIVMDAVHIPYGCSVRGNFWMAVGETDIMQANGKTKMSLHANDCMHSNPPSRSNPSQFNYSVHSLSAEQLPVSQGQDKGGMYAAHLSSAGVFSWYWPHAAVPKSIISSGSGSWLDPSDWGAPMSRQGWRKASQRLHRQHLVLDIELCENLPCCSTRNNDLCSAENVSTNYDAAFFEIKYIRAYAAWSSSRPPLASNQPSASKSPTPRASYSIMVATNLSWSTFLLWGFWFLQVVAGLTASIVILLKISGNSNLPAED